MSLSLGSREGGSPGETGEARGDGGNQGARRVPSFASHSGAFASTRLILSLRWRMIRSRWSKGFIVAAAFMVFGALLVSINLGFAVQMAAQSNLDQASGVYARAWVLLIQSDSMGELGALAVGGAVLIAIFAPFTGSATTSLIPSDDLLGVRPKRSHRFFDALLVNSISGIGLLQFVSLTAITSLVCLDGERLWAMLFAWSMWLMLVTLTTWLAFLLEWVQRRFGRTTRTLFGVLFGAALVAAIVVDEDHGRSLFGLSQAYSVLLRLSVEGFVFGSLFAVAGVWLVTIALLVSGMWIAERALFLAPRKSNGGASRRAMGMSMRPALVTFNLLWRTVWRTKECRRPVIAILVVGLPVVAFINMGESLEIALPMTVPLAVSLAWGVNVFGVVGAGLNWIGGQPHIMRLLPRVAFLFQAGFSFALLTLLWLVSWVAGRAQIEEGRLFILSSFMVALLTASLSLFLSVSRPLRAPFTGSGDALVPPLTALGYLVLLVSLGCLPAIVMVNLEEPTVQIVGVVGGVALSAIVAFVSFWLWESPERRARAIATVSAE